MVHWFDRLSKAVARASLVREGSSSTSDLGPLSLVDTGEATTLQAGPCFAELRGDELVRRYSTQTSLPDRGLLHLDVATTRNFNTGESTYHLSIGHERGRVLDLWVDSGAERAPAMTLTRGEDGHGAHVLAGAFEERVWRWTIDGRSDPELDRLMASDSAELMGSDSFAGLPIDALGLDETLRDGVERLSYRALRDAPTCMVVPQAMHTMSGEQLPDCVACVDKCDDDRFECGARQAQSPPVACGDILSVWPGSSANAWATRQIATTRAMWTVGPVARGNASAWAMRNAARQAAHVAAPGAARRTRSAPIRATISAVRRRMALRVGTIAAIQAGNAPISTGASAARRMPGNTARRSGTRNTGAPRAARPVRCAPMATPDSAATRGMGQSAARDAASGMKSARTGCAAIRACCAGAASRRSAAMANAATGSVAASRVRCAATPAARRSTPVA